MADSIHIFKRKLTNLSSANPYLWIRRLKEDVFLDLAQVGEVRSISTWGILNDVFSGKKSISVCSLANHSDSKENQLSLKFGSLLRKQKLTIQERGTNELHLAFPFVLGQWPDGTWVKTPLLLIPVLLEAGQKTWQIHPNLDGILVNPAFLLAYSFHFKQELESTLFEKSLNIDADDGIQFLTLLYNRLKESRLEIHFNQSLFSSSIQPFGEIRMDNLPRDYQPGMLRLQPEAVLGLFPQSDSILIPDFQYLEDNQVDIDSIFLKELKNQGPIKEKNLLCPLPTDGSQEACIREVKSGKSLVVQGPPGTGKSQLIANLMADAMGNGKSVLLVCQKKVALEVVRERLSEIGFGDFVAIWADFKNDKSLLFSHLMKVIEEVEASEKEDSNLNTVVLERNFNHVCQTLDMLIQKLETWNLELQSSKEAGISILELYQSTRKQIDSDFSFSKFTQLSLSDWKECKEWLRLNWDSFISTLGPNSIVNGRKNWELFSENRLELPKIFNRIHQGALRLRSEIQKVGFQFGNNLSVNLEESKRIADQVKEKFRSVNESDFQLWKMRPLSNWLEDKTLKDLTSQMLALKNIHEDGLEWPFEFGLTDEGLTEWINRINSFKSLSSNWLIVSFYSFFSVDVKWAKEKIEAFNLQGRPLNQLKQKLNLAKEWIAIVAKIGFLEKPEISKETIQVISIQINEWEKGKNNFSEFLNLVRQFKKYWPNLDSWESLDNGIGKVYSWNQIWAEIEKEWSIYFPSNMDLETSLGQIPSIIEFYDQNLGPIFKTDKALANAPAIWNTLVMEVVKFPDLARYEKSDFLEIMENSWKNSWIFQIESNHPDLSETDSEIWKENISILRNMILEKAELVKQILKLRLRERRYKNLEYNRLGNRITYRELYHKVSKKRMKPSLRQLWKDHQYELSNLIPAWLATPESVSATWPMTTSFDLVIFDESSQCFAERGIPSAFRGRQLVIVGDDKQLPPHQLFSARWEEGEEDQFSGQDSLLDLAKQFLPQKMLTHHYRSDFPELIAFSNQHFYNNQLELIPDFKAFLDRSPALQFKKVNGMWKNQTNEAEANFIVDELIAACERNSNLSIGVITFNVRQQELIEKLIESAFFEAGISIPESLFVKNIENVQGDERDHIFFSIGYALGENGKVVSQFGSLSISGGENRLNVAITRARKSIVLVSSILPDELPVSESSPMGPKLLKRYLRFAFEGIFNSKANNTKMMLNDRFKYLVNSSGKEVEFPNSDLAFQEIDGSISLHFWDCGVMLNEHAIKNHFGFKYLALSKKGYNIHYHYSRNLWQNSYDQL